MVEYKVLVADDLKDEASVLCEGLKLNHYQAEAVHTGEAALARCIEGNVDLLLLDVGLPDIDGYEVCRRLRENPNTQDQAVVFVTAHDHPGAIQLGYDLGALDYITKPYNLPIVMVRVDSAMHRHTRGTNEPFEPIADPAYTDELTGLRNQRYLMERLQEEVERAHRYDYPVSCLVADVDEIIALDTELGAVAMDDLLAEVAIAVRCASRNYDIIAHYDNGLFAVLLPHTCLDSATLYARKVQEDITATTFSDPSFPTHARMSFGIASCRNGKATNADNLFGAAMKYLLRAKNSKERIAGFDLNAV